MARITKPKPVSTILATPSAVSAPPFASVPTMVRRTRPDDVVDYGSAEDHLRFIVLEMAEIGENTRGDADRCRSERGTEEDRDHHLHPEEVSEGEAAEEREDHTDDGNGGCRSSNLHQFPQIGLEADQKQQQDHAELGEQMDGDVVRIDEMKAGNADDHAADELTEHGGLAQTLGDLAANFRGDKDRDQG